MADRGNNVPILMYHALLPESVSIEEIPAKERMYAVRTVEFERHLSSLEENGFSVQRLEDVLAWQRNERELSTPAVVLSFDDGHVSNHDIALPLLKKYGYTAEFFITTGFVGKEGYLTPEQIKEMKGCGMGIGSHAVTHRYLSDLPIREIREELRTSKRLLEQWTGETVWAFSLPGGRISSRVLEEAREAGYIATCNSFPSSVRRGESPFELGRYSISRGMSASSLISLLRGEWNIGRRVFQAGTAMGKKVLGNSKYDRIREILLERFSRDE